MAPTLQFAFAVVTVTYDHIHEKVRDPVRSPLVKLVRARLVVGSVTSESLVLSVLFWRLKVSQSDFLASHALSGSFRPVAAAQRRSSHCGARRIDPIGGLSKRPADMIGNDHI